MLRCLDRSKCMVRLLGACFGLQRLQVLVNCKLKEPSFNLQFTSTCKRWSYQARFHLYQQMQFWNRWQSRQHEAAQLNHRAEGELHTVKHDSKWHAYLADDVGTVVSCEHVCSGIYQSKPANMGLIQIAIVINARELIKMMPRTSILHKQSLDSAQAPCKLTLYHQPEEHVTVHGIMAA